ncbi:pyrrolo-quinoline quinone [Halorubrum distributum JCM 9100]|uniref:Pyrrolo-quinoline quinone n=2 Tax=Halorubrum distributum TaxID=29283 RepID=M0EZH1_9EURY|nr:pyrrolo-quinoline quinone [Halorubrum distributum JCM 9100]ELZ58930.1 pyrrolo-quinoline quinone [Halorubrum distributum JCM 10118]
MADDTVYIGNFDGRVYALDAGDGTKQWEFQTDGDVSSSPVVADGIIYVATWNDDHIHALNVSDGTERWRFQIDAAWSAAAVVNGTVYVGSRDSHIYALSER